MDTLKQPFYKKVLYKQKLCANHFKNHLKANNLFQNSNCRISLHSDLRVAA